MNDLDERYTYVFGGSVWYVEWDSTIKKDNANGSVRVHCLSPLDFIPQPGIYEVENMDYCFLRFTTSREELRRRYGIKEELLSLAECEYSYAEQISDNDAVTLINAIYKDERGRIGKLIFSGDLILDDLPCYYARWDAICEECGESKAYCSCGGNTVYEDKYTEVLPEGVAKALGGITFADYYMPNEIPVIIRRNTRCSPSLYGLSDCERIRPQQQAINKVESRILKKLLRSGVTPVMPEDATITPGNSIFGDIIRMRPGESLENYGKIDTTPDISQDIMEADRLYEHAKRVLGISDALQGTDKAVMESGYARNLKISRAESRLETKKRMKYHAYSALYELIFKHFLAFADEPRILSYKDFVGDIHTASFNRYDFLEMAADRLVYTDSFLFSVDLNIENDYSREALWQKNLINLETGALGDRSSPQTLLRYWQTQERAHYPFARENVEYFTSLISMQKENETNQ